MPTISKHDLLDLAKSAVADRGLNYGSPEDNFARIARRWTVHLINIGLIQPGQELPLTSVAIMCGDIKIARLENQPSHLDSWVDLAGYAACGGNLACEAKKEPQGYGYEFVEKKTYDPLMRPWGQEESSK